MVLTDLIVPILSQNQIDLFTKKNLLSHKVYFLNFQEILDVLRKKVNQQIGVIDIGKTAIKAAILKVNSDGIIKIEKMIGQEDKIGDGKNYLQFILKVKSKINKLPIGISIDEPINEQGKLDTMTSLKQFNIDITNEGGFQIFFNKELSILNDCTCLALASYYNLMKTNIKTKQLITVINGGGIGGAIVNSEGEVFACEPGHLPVVEVSLNPNGIKEPCGFTAGEKTCLEQVGAVGVGIETQWFKLRHEKINGEQISNKIDKDQLALQLFNTSALIIAHVIEGLRKAHNFQFDNTGIVCHGGAFKAKGYIERIRQILEKYAREKLNYNGSITLITEQEMNFENACMTGAAIAALSTGAVANRPT